MSDVLARLRAHDLSHLLAERGWYHSMSLPNGEVIEGLQPERVLRERVSTYPIPTDLAGKTLLDVGSWDGWFTFEMERRGAQVTAVDNAEQPNFHYARARLGSRAVYREMDVYEIDPALLGTFDYVLFLGVHYHLKHPLLGLEKVCGVTRELAIVEGFVADQARAEGVPDDVPWLQFYENDELGGQLDNWFGPSVSALQALCRTAGFCRVELLYARHQRAALACYRHWLPAGDTTEGAPRILGAVNSRTKGINFQRRFDDYICCWVHAATAELTRDTVFPEVGSFGIYPIHVCPVGPDTWQVTFSVPPGLGSGWHAVTIRTARSRASDPVSIPLDVAPATAELTIAGACDGANWRAGEVSRESYLACWIDGAPVNADRHNVHLYLGEHRLFADHVSDPDEQGRRQVNAALPRQITPGAWMLTARIAKTASPAFAVRIL